MSDKNLVAEVRRLNEIIKAVERQRNEALAARAQAEAANSMIQDALKEKNADLNAAKDEIASLKAKLAEIDGNRRPDFVDAAA